MEEIARKSEVENTPLPCEYFDLIGGTSTGGLIAIMLGRLRMVCCLSICRGRKSLTLGSLLKNVLQNTHNSPKKFSTLIKSLRELSPPATIVVASMHRNSNK
jgi:hypothetical protein